MQQLINDIRKYEQNGPRDNNYEHMFQMLPVAGIPTTSIISTLLYLKQYPLCETFIGTSGLSNRQRFARITHSIHWTQEQETPFNIVVSDNVEQWMNVAEGLGLSFVRVCVPTAAKHNLKLQQKYIDEQKPQIVFADYTQLTIIQKMLGQDRSVDAEIDDECKQYYVFANHSTNSSRTSEDLQQMDQVISQSSYIRDCVRNIQMPVFISRHKVIAGSVPQRLIFDKHSSRAKLAIHSKCTWLVNNQYPIYGSYMRSIYNSVSKLFALRDYLKEYLKLIPAEHIHDTVSSVTNIHQLFLRNAMPIIKDPTQIPGIVSRLQNINLLAQIESKRGDPCPICMNEYTVS